MPRVDRSVEQLALHALTNHFDLFIDACIGPDGHLRAPSIQAFSRARACLPPDYKWAYPARKQHAKPNSGPFTTR